MSEQTPEKTSTPRAMSFHVLEDGTVRADFHGLDPLTFNPGAFPESILPMAVTEGVIQNLRSAGSRISGDERTPAKLRELVAARLAAMLAGEWRPERESAGESESYTIDEEAAHVFRKLRFEAENPGQAYTGTLAADAAAYSALDETRQKALKATARFQQARTQVKLARDAVKAAKLAKKAEKEEAKPEEAAPF